MSPLLSRIEYKMAAESPKGFPDTVAVRAGRSIAWPFLRTFRL